MKARHLLASAILCAIPAFGHHYSLAEFDVSRTVRISGTISKVEFSNPHVTFSLDVKNSDGTLTHWTVGTASPNVLIRGGITKVLLAQGTAIVVDAYPAKDGSPKANVRTLTLADGRQLITRDPGQNCDGEPFSENCIRVQVPVK
jgi:hypothetical protein